MTQKRRIPGMVHLPLFVLLGISFWQTGVGFSDLLGDVVSWGFSFAITMLMYYLTIHIGTKRINSQPVLGLLVFYFACSIFSYAGNFNAVYTQYQTEQLYRDELLKHKQQLNDVLNATNKALNNLDPDTTAKRNRVESLTQQLVSQITDPARPGLGKRALELISEIEAILGEKLTEFGTGQGDWQALAQRYQENIDQVARRKITAGDYNRGKSLMEENNNSAEELNKAIDSALFSATHIKNIGYEINLKVVNGINEIGSKTQEFINDPSKFKFEPVKFESQEIGKIAFSFKSAFIQHLFIAILFTIFCFALDWLVVLYLMIRYRKGETDPYEPSPSKGVDL